MGIWNRKKARQPQVRQQAGNKADALRRYNEGWPLTIEEVSQVTTLSIASVRDRIWKGQLKATNVGPRRQVVLNEEVRRFLAEGMV